MLGYVLGVLATKPAVILAAAKSTGKEQVSGFGSYGMIILLAVMMAAIYFTMFRPQRKKVQQQEEMLRKVEIGDEVVTIGRVHGTIAEVSDDTVVIEVDDGVSITFDRSAISKNLTAIEREEAAAEEEVEEEVEEEPAEEEVEEEPEVSQEEEAEEPPGQEDKDK